MSERIARVHSWQHTRVVFGGLFSLVLCTGILGLTSPRSDSISMDLSGLVLGATRVVFRYSFNTNLSQTRAEENKGRSNLK